MRESVRDRIRDYADERDMTYAEAVEELLPSDPVEDLVVYGDSVTVTLYEKDIEKLRTMAGRGATHGDVLEYYIDQHNE